MQCGRQIEGVCTLLDLSKTGTRVVANYLTNSEVGTLLRLTVTFDDASRILLSGKICWVETQPKGSTIGIQFENLELYSQQMLGFYLL